MHQPVYTVLPYSQGYFLDLPFHLQRLYEAFTDDAFKPSLETFANKLLDEIAEAKVQLESDPNCRSGIATVCTGRCKEKDSLSFSSLVTVMPSLEIGSIEGESLRDDRVMVGTTMYTRSDPQRKSCSWPEERKPLEVNRSDRVSEILLCATAKEHSTDAPGLYATEGLITNFFAVNSNENRVITDEDSCLSGSMARLVIATCDSMGLPIERKPPDLLQAGIGWDAAFLTSATKPITTVGSFTYLGSDGSNHDALAEIENSNQEIVLGNTTPDLLLDIKASLLACLRDRAGGALSKSLGYPLWWSCDQDFSDECIISNTAHVCDEIVDLRDVARVLCSCIRQRV
jgi:hypothetical protein